MKMQRVFNFSGGRTSAYMTAEFYRPGDLVIFCDTTREHPKTYKFINDFEAHENIPVIRLTFPGGWKGFLSGWGKQNKLPNSFKRQCTIDLKIKTARRYLRSLGLMEYQSFIGFRADERERVKKHIERWKRVKTLFPLFDAGIDKGAVLAYWENKPYNLEIPPLLGNCDACFMKGKNAIIAIYQQFPELAEKWIRDEESSDGYTYLKGITHRQMLERSKVLNTQYDLLKIQPEFSCACGT